MKFRSSSSFPRVPRSPSRKVTGPLRLLLILLFFAFAFGCICLDFYLIEQALVWVDPPMVWARPPQPVRFEQFALGPRNLFAALIDQNVTRQDANALVVALKDADFEFGALRPKQQITLKFDAGNRPVGFHYRLSKIVSFQARRLADGTFDADRREVPTRRVLVTLTGRVTTSVWNTIIDLGEMPTLTAKFIEIFGWDIDFSSDTQRGDSFVLILEKIETEQGEPVGYGRLFAGQYHGSTVGLKQGFFFDHPVEKLKGFYTAQGKQMKKFMLRAPLDSLRVTSRFGFRMHPTLHRRKKHNGIDYRAPTGTPVWAVADGTVMAAGSAGAAGKRISIDHGNSLQSYYMHLSRISVKRGQKVHQRKLIGRVGSTGRSTGPHLHFGLKYKGQWTDPRKRKFGKVVHLDAKYMDGLKEVVDRYAAELKQAAALVPELPAAPDATPPPEMEKPLS